MKYILTLALLLPAWTWALYSNSGVEQARNVRGLEVVQERIEAVRVQTEIRAGRMTRTFTPTQVVRRNPTITMTPTPTPRSR